MLGKRGIFIHMNEYTKVNKTVIRINREDTSYRILEDVGVVRVDVDEDSLGCLIISCSHRAITLSDEEFKTMILLSTYNYCYPRKQTYLMETMIRISQIIVTTMAMLLLNKIHNGQYLMTVFILGLSCMCYLREPKVSENDLDILISTHHQRIWFGKKNV